MPFYCWPTQFSSSRLLLGQQNYSCAALNFTLFQLSIDGIKNLWFSSTAWLLSTQNLIWKGRKIYSALVYSLVAIKINMNGSVVLLYSLAAPVNVKAPSILVSKPWTIMIEIILYGRMGLNFYDFWPLSQGNCASNNKSWRSILFYIVDVHIYVCEFIKHCEYRHNNDTVTDTMAIVHV